MEEINWLPSECAPRRYPAQVIAGAFYYPRDAGAYIRPGRVVHQGWGEIGSVHLVGKAAKPLPDMLRLSWFSYVEDKGYAGEFQLPVEEIEKEFQAGPVAPAGKSEPVYDRVVAGMAPEGHVSVWIAGAGVFLKVAEFVAEETEFDWRAVLDNEFVSRTDHISEVLTERLGEKHEETSPIPPVIPWSRRKEMSPWTVKVLAGEAVDGWLKTHNGEREWLDFAGEPPKKDERAVPQFLEVNWRRAGKRTLFSTKITFDEEEVFKAYDTMIADDSGEALELQVEVSLKAETNTVSLVGEELSLEFLKGKAITYKVK